MQCAIVCRLPQATIGLEFTEYTVRETIGNENLALQVCAVATDIAFPVRAEFIVYDGTARGNSLAIKLKYGRNEFP